MKVILPYGKKFQRIFNRCDRRDRRVEDKVRRILDDVKAGGDEAVIRYTRKFDKVKLTPRELRVSEGEINGAYQNISPDFISMLKIAVENVSWVGEQRIGLDVRRKQAAVAVDNIGTCKIAVHDLAQRGGQLNLRGKRKANELDRDRSKGKRDEDHGYERAKRTVGSRPARLALDRGILRIGESLAHVS